MTPLELEWNRSCVGCLGVLVRCTVSVAVRLAFTSEVFVRPKLGVGAGTQVADVFLQPAKIGRAAGVNTGIMRISATKSP